ncbi:MAG: dCMP deaminase family protein [Eubacteriaceae bacterium]|nr:dCMP deaminase family protein [Eubacteriaceae bacterium]
MKRQDYITWDEYFMGIALLSARRSKDPNTQVGACIVNERNIILSTGYNGMPKGCSDDDLPWDRDGDFQHTKYAYVCHAELNAILNSDGRSLADAILYVTCFPCNECAKAIIQAGIKKVVYLEDKYPDADATCVSRKLFDMVEITLEQFKSTQFENGLTLYN